MTPKKTFIGVRLGADDLEALDKLASQHGCSRTEAARIAVRSGVKLASRGRSVDLTRVALLVEYTQAALDMIVHREHGDAAGELARIARERMDQFHAS